MTTKTITIDPRVALTEESALVDHYRNRALVLAQTLFERDVRVAELEKELADMKDQAAVAATDREE
ncbi:hypothetical protein CN138_14635 [Sinorhizobium meliloti]|uniref:hypothetical protein n=1 Tax=Rhizobium meliloti TaxID=382 RepID=UPI000FD39509|nr:hypothetical protein [Sinorhizobium meliloti]RVL38837.1 hypothetical protein CN145_36535 [Sinorhizobium meliloti]RVL70681.1 hypothetical protein CN138_14635 [Sinorhizobium meliloti]RVP58650.1 hypothetical protein CN076_18020 [Sinorhizobium meliloti]RVP90323.1 hypothetical protein CN073_11725 [Sinorhizobium meliloti]